MVTRRRAPRNAAEPHIWYVYWNGILFFFGAYGECKAYVRERMQEPRCLWCQHQRHGRCPHGRGSDLLVPDKLVMRSSGPEYELKSRKKKRLRKGKTKKLKKTGAKKTKEEALSEIRQTASHYRHYPTAWVGPSLPHQWLNKH